MYQPAEFVKFTDHAKQMYRGYKNIDIESYFMVVYVETYASFSGPPIYSYTLEQIFTNSRLRSTVRVQESEALKWKMLIKVERNEKINSPKLPDTNLNYACDNPVGIKYPYVPTDKSPSESVEPLRPKLKGHKFTSMFREVKSI